MGGAFAVHQLRFVVSYGSDARRVLTEAGHEYLPFAGAAACVLLLLAAVLFTRSLIAGGTDARPQPRALAVRRAWVENSLALVATYVAQEGLEGALAPGHSIWGHGGWTVVPLAIAIGGVAALLTARAERALAAVRRPAGCPVAVDWSLAAAAWNGDSVATAELDELARHLAGRAPPRVALLSL